MNLMPPPALTGNMEQDVKALSEWTIEVHRFLQYPGGDTTWETVVSPPLHRAKFTWKDADEIYLGVGMYRHMGTKTQNVYWDSQLTFQFGSGGSNADSEDLAASDWFYVYLDDSAIVTAGTNVITATEIVANITEPTWSDAKHGWYNGNDRCIFAVRTDGSSNILEFFHEDDLVLFATPLGASVDIQPGATWTDSAQIIPKFTRRAEVGFRAYYIDATAAGYWRTNGQAGTNGTYILYISANDLYVKSIVSVITDANGIIEFKFSGSSNNYVCIWTEGWYFSKGM